MKLINIYTIFRLEIPEEETEPLNKIDCVDCNHAGFKVINVKGMVQTGEQNKKMGYPNSERLVKLMNYLPDIPKFTAQEIRNIIFPPCAMEKTKRTPIQEINRHTIQLLELVHLDIKGPYSVK